MHVRLATLLVDSPVLGTIDAVLMIHESLVSTAQLALVLVVQEQVVEFVVTLASVVLVVVFSTTGTEQLGVDFRLGIGQSTTLGPALSRTTVVVGAPFIHIPQCLLSFLATPCHFVRVITEQLLVTQHIVTRTLHIVFILLQFTAPFQLHSVLLRITFITLH